MLVNKNTFTRDFSWILLQVPCAHAYASWAVEGVVVTGNFRRDPDKSCSFFTVANIHINSECAKRRSVCIALFLLIRDVCLKLGAVVLTGDFNNGAECELSPRCYETQRRISPLEAAFSFCVRPLAYLGVPPQWGSGDEPHRNTWSECCGFLILPESQREWLIMKHWSFNVKRAEPWPQIKRPNLALRTLVSSQLRRPQTQA